MPAICFGDGKLYWARRFAAEHDVNFAESFFYTDSVTDVPMLEIVGHPRVVNPDPLLRTSLSFGSFTWFNALGIFAPIAGLPFLLMEWGGGLSFMSWVGHILFGFIAAYVFERLEAR